MNSSREFGLRIKENGSWDRNRPYTTAMRFSDARRRANAERECYEALFARDWLCPKGGHNNERRGARCGGSFRGSRMGGNADRARPRVGGGRVLVRGECHCRPESQQQAQTRYSLRYRPHEGFAMETSLESIPESERNAMKEYLAGYVS